MQRPEGFEHGEPGQVFHLKQVTLWLKQVVSYVGSEAADCAD